MTRTLIHAVLLSFLPALPCAGQRGTDGADGPPERVVYSSYRPAGWDIYLYEAPGSEAVRLTDHPALDYSPTFSADGRWVVFTSERDGNPSLYVVDREHEAPPRLLVRSDAMQDQAALSPDGRWIAFVSTHGGNADIYRLPFRPEEIQDLAEAVNLTRHPGGDFRPAFSPDGGQIAFSSDRDGQPSRHPAFPFALRNEGDVYVMASDGTDVRRLTDAPGWDGSPAWTADGAELVFYSERDESLPYRIYSLALSGDEPRAVSPEGTPALAPMLRENGDVLFSTWSQQGPSRHWHIRSVRPDGSSRDESASNMDCFDPDIHRASGAMVCHGGPPLSDETIAGFAGPLLVEGSPLAFDLSDRTVALIGARHAFTTPPHPTLDEILYRESPRRIGVASTAGEDPTGLLDLDELSVRPPGAVSHLRYSRDGAWISFTAGPFAGPPGAEADVWRMRTDGTDLRNLTPDTPGNDALAELSPDGSRFVFRSGRTGDFDIYLANGDGSAPLNLTNHPASETFPAFSPLGNQIAFVSDRNGVLDAVTKRRTFDIYTLDLAPDGTPGKLQQITSNSAQDAHVGYSPDGAWLIYTSGKSGLNDEAPLVQEVLFNPQMYGEIHAYHLEDGSTVRLTHNKWEDGAPTWTTPVRASARPSVASVVADVVERAGADSAAVRYRTLAQTSPMAYRFGDGGLYWLANGFLRDGNARAANETFRLMTLLQPESLRPYVEMGDAFLAKGDTTSAVEMYRTVLARDPEHPGAAGALFELRANEDTEVALTPDELSAYAGSYSLRGGEVTLEFSVQSGQLFVLGPGQPAPFPLTAVSGDRFLLRPAGVEMRFMRDQEGNVTSMESRQGGGPASIFDRVEQRRSDPRLHADETPHSPASSERHRTNDQS